MSIHICYDWKNKRYGSLVSLSNVLSPRFSQGGFVFALSEHMTQTRGPNFIIKANRTVGSTTEITLRGRKAWMDGIG